MERVVTIPLSEADMDKLHGRARPLVIAAPSRGDGRVTEQLRILAPLHRICTLLSYTRLAAHIGRVLGTVVCSMLTRTLRTR